MCLFLVHCHYAIGRAYSQVFLSSRFIMSLMREGMEGNWNEDWNEDWNGFY